MVSGGKFGMAIGEWTDDTAMALCLARSLIECNGFNAYDQMERYARWIETGYCSTRTRGFGIGQTVLQSLINFHRYKEPFSGSTNPKSAGNGALMRLAPVPMFFYPDRELAIHYAMESARTTHAADECLWANQLFTNMLMSAFDGMDKVTILTGQSMKPNVSDGILSILRADYRDKSISDIRGTGYVVESLEAALWCFSITDNFEDAVLQAANLGDDADTTAAICGQIAGAYYGVNDIPGHWIDRLHKTDEIREIADQLSTLTDT
jgi:ADP-ribosyl-[dinitrogen reductase] hydrolase